MSDLLFRIAKRCAARGWPTDLLDAEAAVLIRPAGPGAPLQIALYPDRAGRLAIATVGLLQAQPDEAARIARTVDLPGEVELLHHAATGEVRLRLRLPLAEARGLADLEASVASIVAAAAALRRHVARAGRAAPEPAPNGRTGQPDVPPSGPATLAPLEPTTRPASDVASAGAARPDAPRPSAPPRADASPHGERVAGAARLVAQPMSERAPFQPAARAAAAPPNGRGQPGAAAEPPADRATARAALVLLRQLVRSGDEPAFIAANLDRFDARVRAAYSDLIAQASANLAGSPVGPGADGGTLAPGLYRLLDQLHQADCERELATLPAELRAELAAALEAEPGHPSGTRVPLGTPPPADRAAAERDRVRAPQRATWPVGDPVRLASLLARLDPDAQPALAAETARALGVCYQALYDRTGDPPAAAAAAAAFGRALERFGRRRAPGRWAETQQRCGELAARRYQWTGDPAAADEAERAFRGALEVWTPTIAPRPWAAVQRALGGLLASRYERVARPEDGQAAEAAFEQALTVFDRQSAPLDWADLQRALGDLAARRYARTWRAADAAAAERRYRLAREAYDAAGEEGAARQVRLALGLHLLRRCALTGDPEDGRAAEEHLEQALGCSVADEALADRLLTGGAGPPGPLARLQSRQGAPPQRGLGLVWDSGAAWSAGAALDPQLALEAWALAQEGLASLALPSGRLGVPMPPPWRHGDPSSRAPDRPGPAPFD